MADFSFKANLKEIADKLGQTTEAITARVKAEVGKLSISTHAFVVAFANERLTGFNRDHFFGKNNKNVRWTQVADGYWVVEIDESVRFIEEGRNSVFMGDWLLKPGAPGVKTAKDGCVLNPRNKVLTTKGWIRIKDVKAGMMVLTHSGKFREVKELLVRPTPINTEYVRFMVKEDRSKNTGKALSEISSPSISLTSDHLVLTPNGWVEAGKLKKGDLVAAPADLKRRCKMCDEPLPINTPQRDFCLNNSCSRKYSYSIGKGGLASITKEMRIIFSKIGNLAAKKTGCFNREDWGARNSEVLKKMREGSNNARRLWGNGTEPELFFEKALKDNNIVFDRERPILTDRIVNAGKGRTKRSTCFFDFYIPDLKLAIEIDGAYWHSLPESVERDRWKELAAARDGITLWRIPAKEVYKTAEFHINNIKTWGKNHSGELGVCWVPIVKYKKGTVDRPDHVYAKKYDILLDDQEHSFACQTIFIHNSNYRVIPMNQTKNSKKDPILFHNIKYALQQNNIDMKKITKGSDNKPIIGVVAKLGIKEKRTSYPEMHFSEPRNKQNANKLGLPETHGHHYLDNAVVTQRKVGGKVKKEVFTFRVISSKHKQEGRWMYPKVEALNSIPEAYKYANEEWGKIVNSLQQEFTKGLE